MTRPAKSSVEGSPMKLRSVKKVPILHVDATPNDGYVLRILQAYRDNCNALWSTSGDGVTESAKELCRYVNAAQKKRAVLLDAAIRKLRG